MADIPTSSWSETDASNTSAAPLGAPEGMAPSGVNDVLRAHQGAVKRWYNWTIPTTTAGSSTAYTLTYGVAPGALVDGMTHVVQFDETNGASATLNVNSLGAKPLNMLAGSTWVVVPAGLILAGTILRVAYNSDDDTYRILDPVPYVLAQSVSAVATVDFASIPSWVNHLTLEFECTISSDGADVGIRTYGADGVLDTGGSDYYGIAAVVDSSPAVSAAAGAASMMNIAIDADNGTFGVGCFASAQNIQAATRTKFDFQAHYLDSDGATVKSIYGSSDRQEADRITGVRVLVSDGTMTGKFTLTGRL